MNIDVGYKGLKPYYQMPLQHRLAMCDLNDYSEVTHTWAKVFTLHTAHYIYAMTEFGTDHLHGLNGRKSELVHEAMFWAYSCTAEFVYNVGRYVMYGHILFPQ